MHSSRRVSYAVATMVVLGGLVSCGDASTNQPIDATNAIVPAPAAPPATSDGDSTASSPAPTPEPPATTAEPPTTEADDTRAPDPAAPAASLPSGDPAGFRDFVVDGVAVRALTDLEQLPEQATEVELSGTVIDDGNGPQACNGAVQDSYPPQCEGPIVDGLQMGDWAESASGVSFGERNLHVSWPPVDNHVTLIAEQAFEPPPYPEYPTLELPAECADIDVFVDVERLARYANSHPDTTATPYVVDDGRIGVLQVTGDREAIRADLTSGAAEPCLEPVQFSTAELQTAQDSIVQLTLGGELDIGSSGSGNAYNRVTVDVAVSDLATVRALAGAVDDPSILLVFGISRILAG